jgi:hypothetical protein
MAFRPNFAFAAACLFAAGLVALFVALFRGGATAILALALVLLAGAVTCWFAAAYRDKP